MIRLALAVVGVILTVGFILGVLLALWLTMPGAP